jgi:CHAT domain-containing protein
VTGLAVALLQAGARTVLASLWRVSGAATLKFMDAFYQAWLRRGDKAAALADAVAATRDEGMTHPYYWGGFILLGEY